MVTTVRVETVTKKPDLPNLIPAYGITTKRAAREHGEKNGCLVVYWLTNRQRAWAQKEEEK
jgi:hypothetical protein